MTNDYEPRTIVYSCLNVVRKYLEQDPAISFGFVAASDIDKSKQRNGANRRFRFYRIIVNQYFGTKTFISVQDREQRLYLLLNKKSLKDGLLSLQEISSQINAIYEGDFNFSWD